MKPSKYSELGWRGRWLALRNHVLSSPGFQRWAARFPLTRPIARARAGELFDLVAGFVYSQILAACIETGLLRHLFDSPLTAEEVGARIDLPIEGATRLLRAAAALRLVEPIGSAWTLGSAGAAMCGNPGIADMVAHHRLLYADLTDPVSLLRSGGGGGKLAGLWHYAEAPGTGEDSAVAAYSALMAASQPLVAQHVIDAYPFHRHKRLLDVGGGEGAFLAAVGARAPDLQLALFDLPAVGERARARLDDAGLSRRTQIHGGSFLRDPLPHGYDLISLVRVLHDHDDGPAMALLRAVHAALPPGGMLVIAEPMAQTRGAEAAGDAYFGFYLLAMGSGRPRTSDEILRMLGTAGFRESREIPTAMPLTVRVIATTK
ncbi:MAG: methyltransferase [Pseudomonadota bacterium]